MDILNKIWLYEHNLIFEIFAYLNWGDIAIFGSTNHSCHQIKRIYFHSKLQAPQIFASYFEHQQAIDFHQIQFTTNFVIVYSDPFYNKSLSKSFPMFDMRIIIKENCLPILRTWLMKIEYDISSSNVKINKWNTVNGTEGNWFTFAKYIYGTERRITVIVGNETLTYILRLPSSKFIQNNIILNKAFEAVFFNIFTWEHGITLYPKETVIQREAFIITPNNRNRISHDAILQDILKEIGFKMPHNNKESRIFRYIGDKNCMIINRPDTSII